MARMLSPGSLGFGRTKLVQVKELFFDRQAVIRAMDDATYYYLSHQGGYVRKVARNSMKKAPGPSTPGTAPHRHVGLLWKLLLYAFDRLAMSVVVGPTALKGRQPYDNVTVPELLEYGGEAVHTTRKGRDVTATYPARPFMGPALEAAGAQDVQQKHWSEAWARSARKRVA